MWIARKGSKIWLGILCVVLGICVLATISAWMVQEQVRNNFWESGEWARNPSHTSKSPAGIQDRIAWYADEVYEEVGEFSFDWVGATSRELSQRVAWYAAKVQEQVNGDFRYNATGVTATSSPKLTEGKRVPMFIDKTYMEDGELVTEVEEVVVMTKSVKLSKKLRQ